MYRMYVSYARIALMRQYSHTRTNMYCIFVLNIFILHFNLNTAQYTNVKSRLLY